MLENMFNKLQADSRNSLGIGFMEYKMLKTPKVDEDQWKEQAADEIYT